MIDLADRVAEALSQGGAAALPLSFLGGVLAALNPCCFALYPTAASFFGGFSEPGAWSARHNALLFVAGLAAASAALGALAGLTGGILGDVGPALQHGAALVPIALGLHLAGLVRIPLPTGGDRHGKLLARLGAFGVGAGLAVVVVPCATPIVLSLLAVAAHRGDAGWGALLLGVYGAGIAVPMGIMGVGFGAARGLAVIERHWQRLEMTFGWGLVLVGLYLLWTG